ncbi:MAG: ferredoxin [Syntrophomonadaceae bacterium]|nr:ferredoxin [Syntrophomonadaceae bacterium]
MLIARDRCISCGMCFETCPEFFEESPQDTFSQVRERYRVKGRLDEGEAPEELRRCVLDAADACPLENIRVRG